MEEERIITDIISYLFTKGKAQHVAILVSLSCLGPLTLQDIRVALGGERPASYRPVRATLLELEELGLIRKESIGVYRKEKVIVYRLTERGVKVARRLEAALGFSPPEGYTPASWRLKRYRISVKMNLNTWFLNSCG
ncbi:MAG: hypothetical protein QXT28_12375 [Thermofilaceae archaeon]